MLQEHFAYREKYNVTDEKRLKNAYYSLAQKFEKLATENSELRNKFENETITSKKYKREHELMKRQMESILKINTLLTSACSNYEKNWRAFQLEHQFFKHFYAVFLSFLNNQYQSHFKVINISTLNNEVSKFKDYYKTERNYNADTLLASKVIQEQPTDRLLNLVIAPEDHQKRVLTTQLVDSKLYNNQLLGFKEGRRDDKESRKIDKDSCKEYLLELAQELYKNSRLTRLVPNMREISGPNYKSEKPALRKRKNSSVLDYVSRPYDIEISER